ncbi:hypothetical protein PAGU2196_23170 [Pseudomonas sp. PAGU 2196]|uniref:HEPN domain-containing protein n=1 Tax=Pseudomonas sp. PAGU 2196 TaxID=2793997 RepID=UPI001EDFF273|nr:HEPN domain-containing protein [Pseudomonas sp. PAGU 2196]GHS81483.1 hypothetical protein PAGU2196_23170 [Pseudomonas sp. PAGU 2196]
MDFDEKEYQEYLEYVASRPTLTEERNHRNHWYNRARDLRAAAGAVWYAMRSENDRCVAESLGMGFGYSMGVACYPVYHMLCGQALEVIMKAVLVSRGETPPEVHKLNDLADLVGVKRNQHQKRLLSFYEASIWWAGRYPIPKKANDQLIRDYWKLARNVMEKAVPGKEIRFVERSGATDWEKFDALWCEYADKFEHGF